MFGDIWVLFRLLLSWSEAAMMTVKSLCVQNVKHVFDFMHNNNNNQKNQKR